MDLHLEPLGGISGDMFISAILDCCPELVTEIPIVFSKMGLSANVNTSYVKHKDHTLSGSRFTVIPKKTVPQDHLHTSFRTIRRTLQKSGLSLTVIERATDIFAKLADAESRAHGCPPEDVTFHEVGAWDSIADITFAAFLIDAVAANSWSVSAIPLGSGQVSSQHGILPVPAPATHFLLEGFVMVDDGHLGERVTPTGAAILKHLEPSYGGPSTPAKLTRSGIGFGTKTFQGMSNILRASQFEPHIPRTNTEQISVITFEVDDQTPEDLAIGIDNLRHLGNIIDVTQNIVFGKKGRQAMQLQVLCLAEHESQAMDACFNETTTIGIRYHRVNRRILNRTETLHKGINVKTVMRSGKLTAKADIDDVAQSATSHNSRVDYRTRAESSVLKKLK
tara:strand:- start:5829 stop:7007 length:1179 start_codon:yes stop_codon:yes gene_type:complete